MKLSSKAIDRPRVVIIATILVLALAVLAGIDVPVQRTPAINTAVVLVAVPYPGALPTETETQITREIERALQRLNDVDFISSTSMRGSSVTQVVFLDGVDPDEARGEVKDLVDQVRRELPVAREVQPIVTKIDFENSPLMLVNMTPPDGFDQRALKELAEEVQDDLETIQGISTTQLFGGREQEIHVNVDIDLANQHGLTMADFRQSIKDYHAEMPGGRLDTGDFDYQVRNETKFRDVDDIREVVLRQDEGRVIRIGDLAEVVDTHRRLQNIARLDGNDCATIIVYKESDINTYDTALRVKSRVKEIEQQYPMIKFSVTRDTSEEIGLMFRVLGSSFLFGAMLVLLILSWSMGFRISILVLLAVPLSSAVALIFLYFFEVPISNMVIFSFILVLGMVVDGAIIVAENIHRHIESGEDPVTASKRGIEEVGTPVIMADLTTVAAYLPMLLVPGIMGDFMGVMPKVVSVALLGSVLVDHFLIPVLAARWYSRRTATDMGESRVESVDNSLTQPKSRFAKAYMTTLRWALENRWAVVLGSIGAIAWAGFMLRNIGFEFFPESDRGQFEIRYELPLGNSIEQTIAAAEVFHGPLRELSAKKNDDGVSDLRHFVSAIGSSEGLASRLENDPAVGPEFGTIMVQLLSPLDRHTHQNEFIADLRKEVAKRADRFPGIEYSIDVVQEGPPGGSDIAVRLTGDDLDQLAAIGEKIVAGLKEMPGTTDARTDIRPENPEIVIEPDPRVAGLFEISEAQIAQAIQTAINGDTSIELNIGDEDVTLRLQAASNVQRSVDRLKRVMLSSDAGHKATIGELASLTRTVGVHAVNRYDRKRAVVAKCNLLEGYRSDDVFRKLREEILPEFGYRQVEGNYMAFLGQTGTPAEATRATFAGENEERDKNFRYLSMSMIIAVVLIFGALVLQFNSFRQSVLVLMTVPLSFVGVVFGMWACQFPFSLASFIGLVSLTGVVVNDAIVVVDFINQARAKGLTTRDAILEAGINRLRPVLLTTATTIGGLLPLMLNLTGGAEFWQPLTGAIVFGLLFATALTLLVIPVGYSLFYNRTFAIGARSELPMPVATRQHA